MRGLRRWWWWYWCWRSCKPLYLHLDPDTDKMWSLRGRRGCLLLDCFCGTGCEYQAVGEIGGGGGSDYDDDDDGDHPALNLLLD